MRFHWEDYLVKHYTGYQEVLDKMDDMMWNKWINVPGAPPVEFNFTS